MTSEASRPDRAFFIARKGEKSDGKEFVGAAIKAGAAAVLTDDPGFRLPVKIGSLQHIPTAL